MLGDDPARKERRGRVGYANLNLVQILRALR